MNIETVVYIDNGEYKEYSFKRTIPKFKIDDIVQFTNENGTTYGIVRESKEHIDKDMVHYTCADFLIGEDITNNSDIGNMFVSTEALSLVTDEKIINIFDKIRIFQ